MVDGRCANTAVVNGAITMTISDVSFDGNAYTVYDERCRVINRLYGNGEMRGFGEHFLVLQDNDTFVIVNAENGQEIGRLYSSSVGQFKHANGRLMVFKDGSKLAVYEVNYSGVSEISSRYG
jgi:hypothetical protein